MATCRGCGAKITWARTENERSMPIDFDPNPEGNVIILAGRRSVGRYGPAPVVRVLAAQGDLLAEDPDEVSIDGKRYMPHHATCPQADQFKNTRGER